MQDNERIRVGDRVTIYRRGKQGTWCADFWNDGHHRRVSLKTGNKKIAMERAVKLGADLIDGKYRKASHTATIASAVEDYLAYLTTESRAPKTIVRYRGELHTFRDFCKGHRVIRLTQITPTHFDRFRAERKKNHALSTLFHEAMVVKQFLKWAVSRHLVNNNPLQGYKVEKPSRQLKPAPSIEHIRAILAASTARRRIHLAMLACTGMRSGELQRLLQIDVDLVGNWIHIVSRAGAETKTRESRKVPMHPALKAMLAEFRKSPGPWSFTADPSTKFPAGDHWISPKKLNEDFVATVKELKLPVGRKTNGFTIHSLRHFLETFCVNCGTPQRVIDTWLGHRSDKSMASVYYSLSDIDSQAFMLKVPFGESLPEAGSGTQE